MTDLTVAIRPARPGDARRIGTVHAQSWVETYPGLLPTAALARLSAYPHGHLPFGQPRHGTLVVEDPVEGVVGYASYGAERGSGLDCDAECYTLYLLQSHQGYGLGGHLFGAVRGALAEARYRRMLLWVLAGNVAARAFYRHLGGQLLGERRSRWGGAPITEIAYGWTIDPAR